jgi:methyl-accepting chemotaxis protein
VKAGLAVAMLTLMVAAILGTRVVSGRAFDTLEADTVASDAHRVSVALDYETRLLASFGSTNSIWDSSYEDVAGADAEAFVSDFPPGDLADMYDVDGAVGIGSDGAVRVGGLVAGDAFGALPAELTPAVLASMVDLAGEAGASRCGLASTAASPYLWCGFPSRRADGSGEGFGLVFLRALDDAALTRLGGVTGLALAVADAGSGPAATDGALSIDTSLGTMAVSTAVEGPDALRLTMSVPTLGDGRLVLTSTRERPIHATDARTANATFAILGVAGVLLLGLMFVLVRRFMHDQVAPLRTTTERIIASGDRSLRLAEGRRGEVAGLSHAINGLLESVAHQTAEVESAQREREQRIIEAHQTKVRTEAQVRERAQERVEATIAAVVEELERVLEQADRVQAASADIETGSAGSETIAAEVLTEAAAADEALGDLGASLAEVESIVATIQAITDQTRMLALNATIEAARAGEIGAGFAVVAAEVRELAGGTSSSAARIADTTGHVGRSAARVAATLEGVTSRVTAVGEASDQVRTVAHEQVATVRTLTTAVHETIARIRAMASAGDEAERRREARLPAYGSGVLELAGRDHPVELRDVSSGGAEVGLVDGVRPAVGDPVRLTLPEELGAATAEATVAWIKLDGERPRLGLSATGGRAVLAEAARRWAHRHGL